MTSEKAMGLLAELSDEIFMIHEQSRSYVEERNALQIEVLELKKRLRSVQHEHKMQMKEIKSIASTVSMASSKRKQSKEAPPRQFSEDLQSETPRYSDELTSNGESEDQDQEGEIAETRRRPSIAEFYMERNMYRRSRSDENIFQVQLDEHSKASFLVRLVRHPIFDTLVGLLILVNTLSMAGEMQYQGMTIGHVLGFQDFDMPPDENWETARAAFVTMDYVFVVIFALELAIRFVAFRFDVFREPLNWIDIVAVSAGILQWIIQSSYVDNMLLRMLRVAKLVARSLRLLKLTKFVVSLHILVKSISSSISTLFWSIILLVMFQFVAGMMFSQLVQPILMDQTRNIDERHQIFSYYGTFTRSQITMFEIHLANFGTACRILVDYCGESYAFIFLAYRCLAGFAVLNVINAVFIQQTISLASRDSEIMFINRHKEVTHYARDLRRLFQELDLDGNGTISLSEWHTVKKNPDFIHIMNSLELNAADTSSLFQLMDLDGDGSITCEELIESALRLRGNARSVDVLAILAQLHRVRASIAELPRAADKYGSEARYTWTSESFPARSSAATTNAHPSRLTEKRVTQKEPPVTTATETAESKEVLIPVTTATVTLSSEKRSSPMTTTAETTAVRILDREVTSIVDVDAPPA